MNAIIKADLTRMQSRLDALARYRDGITFIAWSPFACLLYWAIESGIHYTENPFAQAAIVVTGVFLGLIVCLTISAAINRFARSSKASEEYVEKLLRMAEELEYRPEDADDPRRIILVIENMSNKIVEGMISQSMENPRNPHEEIDLLSAQKIYQSGGEICIGSRRGKTLAAAGRLMETLSETVFDPSLRSSLCPT